MILLKMYLWFLNHTNRDNEKMTDQKLAVLIDADNVPYKNVKEMLEEISRNGTPTIKRIYADWTKPLTFSEYKISIASMIKALSLEFFPVV